MNEKRMSEDPDTQIREIMREVKDKIKKLNSPHVGYYIYSINMESENIHKLTNLNTSSAVDMLLDFKTTERFKEAWRLVSEGIITSHDDYR